MHRSLLLLISPLGVLAATPYSTWMADSVIARGNASAAAVSYETGVIQKSFEASINPYENSLDLMDVSPLDDL